MGLLHSKGQEGMTARLWELERLAQAAGLPLPPPLKLPDLPPVVGGCDLKALAASLGKDAAQALGTQLRSPDIQAVLTGTLETASAQLLGYLDNLDRLKSGLLDQAQEMTGVHFSLGQAQGLLGGLRGALGQPPGSPLAGEVLGTVADACPAVGGLLSYAENTLSAVEGQLAGVSSLLSGVTSQVDRLTNVQTLAQGLLLELDAHLDIQASLFASLARVDLDGLEGEA